MSIAAMATLLLYLLLRGRRALVLERLDEGDDLVDLRVGDLTTEGRHRGREAHDDLGLRIENRLANVVFVDDDVALVGRLSVTPDSLPGRPHELGPRRRVA